MEVGEAVTYVGPAGNTHDALISSLDEKTANIVIISKDGAEDHFGKNRVELRGVPIREVCPCVVKLDSYKPPKKKKKKE
jgi:hypothetical protein